ncbi:MAG: DUF3365 domain-containing protein [Desulfobulbaceae bacterium]|nr:DUF3365 domain-containing protein [Desulfobulbaceae bacterium]
MTKTRKHTRQLKQAFFVITMGWVVIIMAATSWNVWAEYKHNIIEDPKEIARSSFAQNTALRLWFTSHGGVYVPINTATPPNPYLAHVPERDIETPSGKKLTLMCPTYAIRHFTEYAQNMGTVWRHTSLNLLNPDNTPDEWEKAALQAFAQGSEEAIELVDFKGKPHLRLMKPIKYTNKCQKCHGQMDHELGDTHGGVGIYYSMENNFKSFHHVAKILVITYLLVLCVGLLGIWFVYVRQKKSIERQQSIEAAIQHAQKMESIGTLAGGIAHDFNNILSAIIGYAELAHYDLPTGSSAQKDIDQVVKAGCRAKELVKQILTFSRKRPETLQPLQPAPIIREALKLIRASLPTTIEIQEAIDPNCGSILANLTKVHQILMNLCTNALHAMAEQQGILTVKLSQVELKGSDLIYEPDVSAGSFVELMVSDTGCGMDKETIERIFEPYFTCQKVGEGTGMGLALVHAIVQESDGFVKVESALGKGTTFHVYFPVIAEKTIEVEEEQNAALPRGDEHILIVDDEEPIVSMFQTTLKQLGYKVTANFSSEKTLELFRSSPDNFDLVITDQTMPNLAGSELAKKILQIRADIPIILCTGYSSVISEESSKEIGIKRFMMKPVSMGELACTVREALDGDSTPAKP